MKVLKFGGKSLDQGLDRVIDIIKNKKQEGDIAVVVSAIGNTTDTLELILNSAKNQENYIELFENFKERAHHQGFNLSKEFETLGKLFEGVALLGDYNAKIKDKVLAQGELISSKILAQKLTDLELPAVAVDSRTLFTANNNFGNGIVLQEPSKQKVASQFKTINGHIPIVTGFIAKTQDGDTITLGRNGSNYSAALLANFLHAEELQNYTHVDGIFTANPDWVKSAQKIEELNFNDANELASFGASILHAKTILPLVENEIPLRIMNTLNPEGKGTLISAKQSEVGIKSISVQSNVALVQMDGRGLLGTVGVDARIFGAMAKANISVGVISQGSSERGIGFVVTSEDANRAVESLKAEFAQDIAVQDVGNIKVRKNLAVISIIGIELQNFDKAYAALVRNKIVPLLFNNAITGKNVSLVLEENQANKAVSVIHGQIFGVAKKVNLAIFGHGLVGGTLIDQIQATAENIATRKNIQLNIFAIGNSKRVLLGERLDNPNWRTQLQQEGKTYTIDKIIQYAEDHHLENLIAIDNTASTTFIENYIPLVQHGFDLVSSNKIGNTTSYDFYQKLRTCLKANHKEYLYETNVGAGLPLIDTIKLLHLSGENITKIKGVFSGSLSYIFNTFSVEDIPFSHVLKQAIEKGYTEPDPREDLSGNDVGRKLLILGRELDLRNEFNEIAIQNLIPEKLQALETSQFLAHLEKLDPYFASFKEELQEGEVLRYIGELSGDLQANKGLLETKLVKISANSPLGQLTGSDSLFEIYTESYGENPIIIQGAGAGAEVTARGVFGDILRLADRSDR